MCQIRFPFIRTFQPGNSYAGNFYEISCQAALFSLHSACASFYPFTCACIGTDEYANGASATQPTLQMVVGFGDNSRLDFWVPASITVSNGGATFTGVLAVTTFTSPNPSGPFATGVL